MAEQEPRSAAQERDGAAVGEEAPRTRVAPSDRLALALVLLAGVLVRLYHVASLPGDKHYFRQTQTLGTIVTYWQDGIDLLRPVIISFGKPGILVLEFPLYQALAAALYKIFGPEVIYARLVTILASVVAAYFVYKIARLFYDRREPLYAAAFFLFTPLGIYYGRVPMLDMLEIALGCAYFYYFAAYVRERRTAHLVLAAVAGSLAFVVKPPYSVLLLVPLAYLYYRAYGARLKPAAITGLAVPVVMMFAWQRYANGVNAHYNDGLFPYEQLEYAIQVRLWPPNTHYFGTLADRLHFAYYVRLAARVGVGILAGLGAVPLIAGLVARVEKRDYLFYAWMAAVLGSFLVFFNLNVVHDYYQMPLLPITAIFCGKGLQVIVERVDARSGRRAAKAALAAFVLLYAGALVAVVYRVGYFEQIAVSRVAVARQIDESARSDAFVAVSTPEWGNFDPSVLYFAGKRGYMVPQVELDEAMLEYLRRSDVRRLFVTEYGAGLSAETRALLGGLPVQRWGALAMYELE